MISRRRAGLTQSDLAARAGTSQATVSAYEHGAKRPYVDTFARLLAAAGARLAVEPAPAVVLPGRERLATAGRRLAEVLALAEQLPARRRGELRYPRLPS